MLPLGEDTAKRWLRQRGLPVPAGALAEAGIRVVQAVEDIGVLLTG